MSNTIHWGFEGTPATFTTTKEKFEVTVSKLRTSLNIHPDHNIIIYSNAANQSIEPVVNEPVNSDSDINLDQPTTLSEDVTVPKAKRKAI
jgi:hypothetical protein